MTPTNVTSVANPPPKTLLIYDGDCRFCRLWIERWREITAGAVDYAELQDVAARFPEVPRAAFENAVKLIETDGRVFSGAEAVYRSLGKGGGSGLGAGLSSMFRVSLRFQTTPTPSLPGIARWRIQ